MSELTELEQQLTEAKALKARADSIRRLYENRDFKELIVKEYLLHDAARWAHQAGDPALSKEMRDDALSMAIATGHLRRYLSLGIQMAAVAERDIPSIEAEIDEVRAAPEGGE